MTYNSPNLRFLWIANFCWGGGANPGFRWGEGQRFLTRFHVFFAQFWKRLSESTRWSITHTFKFILGGFQEKVLGSNLLVLLSLAKSANLLLSGGPDFKEARGLVSRQWYFLTTKPNFFNNTCHFWAFLCDTLWITRIWYFYNLK